MKIRSIPARLAAGSLLAAVALTLTACGNIIYREPSSNYAGRPIPPSGLLQRVLATYTANGSSGGAQILDGLRDIRSNVQNTIPAFPISGFSAADPISILNFPSETIGYVQSYTDGALVKIDYSTEKSPGSAANFGSAAPSVAAAPDGSRFVGAAETSGILGISSSQGGVELNLPNVYKVVINPGNTIILAMVRNSNSLYRVVKLPASANPVIPPGSIDCEPLLLPIYCLLPVAGTYDHPSNAVFSNDGSTVYILNCGPECGGTTAGVTFLQAGALVVTNIPTAGVTTPSPLSTIPVANPLPIPGGVTAAISDGATLYVSGQQYNATTGLFGGNLTTVNLATYAVSKPFSISDGTHTKMLFADDNTLWIGSSQCANGPRAALFATGDTTQASNYNCLSRTIIGYISAFSITSNVATLYANNSFVAGETVNISGLSTATYLNGTFTVLPSGLSSKQFSVAITHADVIPPEGDSGLALLIPQIIPAVNQGASPVTVPYPNTNLNQYYYGSLTGLAWVQNYHKIYTAYGGQIHAFNTTDGSEINNYYITIQGTVLDVAYIDAESDQAD